MYLEVKTAGSLEYSIEGSVQFRILMLSESRNWDSLKVHSPQENVKDADGPAQMHDAVKLVLRADQGDQVTGAAMKPVALEDKLM